MTGLPARRPGMPDEIWIGGNHRYHWRVSATPDEPLPPPPSFPEDIDVVRERVRSEIGRVRVPKSLSPAHPAIEKLLAQDEERRRKQLATPYPIWDTPIFDKPFERRRLRLLNGIFLIVAKWGARPWIQGREGMEVGVTVGQQSIHLIIESRPAAKKQPSTNDIRKKQAERARLRITGYAGERSQAVWEDTDSSRLEDKLLEIAIEMIVAGEIHYRESCRHSYEWQIRRRAELEEEILRAQAEAERQGRERKIREERQRFASLLGQARRLRQASEIRNYVLAIQAAVTGSVSQPHQIQRWCEWALAEADRLDPVKNGAFLRMLDNQSMPTEPD